MRFQLVDLSSGKLLGEFRGRIQAEKAARRLAEGEASIHGIALIGFDDDGRARERTLISTGLAPARA